MIATIFVLIALALVAAYVWARRSTTPRLTENQLTPDQQREVFRSTSLSVNRNSMLP